MNIVKKIVGENKKAWDSKIKYALWEDHITTKTSMGKSPFELVYGLEFQVSYEFPNSHPPFCTTVYERQRGTLGKNQLVGRTR
jgi:hypothetical protein